MKKYLVLICLALVSCNDWLDIKSDKKQVVPSTLKDFQALMDHTNNLNRNSVSRLLEIMSDNVYLDEQAWNSKSNMEIRNAYIWASNILEGTMDYSWTFYYRQVYYSNVVLEELNKSDHTDQVSSKVRGSAYFFRAWAFFQLMQLYAPQYESQKAEELLGIPLRRSSNVDQPSHRATVSECYAQIIEDLRQAKELLPLLPEYQTRPSRQATFGLLAKVYLQMGNYSEALLNAKEALSIRGELMDYNLLDNSLRYPFESFNNEVIFYQTLNTTDFYINPDLYQLYMDNDLRKTLFFHPQGDYFIFKGSYSNSLTYFAGIATDELHLIVSECLARLSRDSEALDVLNYFISHRYSRDDIPLLDDQDILSEVLKQRRLQLVYRGVRWHDLRRLNLHPETQTTLKRDLKDHSAVLMPNEKRYVLAIPDDVIFNNPGMKQNLR